MPELVETAPDGTDTTQVPTSPDQTEPELGRVGKSIYVLATICPVVGAACVGAFTDVDPEKVFPIAFATWAALQGALSFTVVLTEKRADFRKAWEMVTGFIQSAVGLSTFMYAAGFATRHHWALGIPPLAGLVGLYVSAKVVQWWRRRSVGPH